ncbi:MAG: hypothetical protein GIKADHBN_00190 [Phycisphaerales bacterium]|nr:hypothetical protein [Phycisphaerales bacterium]
MAAMQASSVLSTLEADGRRHWIDPKPSFGKLWRWRRAVAYILIAIFTLLPYITINSKPAILLDLSARRFTFFGKTFLPTDTLLMALLFVSLSVGIFLVTAVMGRLWCGWGCPQTVYMEFVYRPIERFFSGTPGRAKTAFQQSALAMVLKYALYVLVSCFLAHTFLAYFVGVERLVQWVQMSPAKHPTPFLVMAVTTGLMLFDFVYFREQTCIVACPYGRFQSVLLDRHSRIITYDRERGEPRGKAVKRAREVALPVVSGGRPAVGDCVDCKLCVTTCPTGIDIRNGLQMECVNCAQCIDACDAVMTRLNRPTGLIRYASEAAMEGEKPRLLRPRVVIYPAILVVLIAAFVVVLLRKADTDVNVLRGMGAPFSVLADSTVANQIKIKIVNRRDRAATYTAAARGAEGVRVSSEMLPITLEPGEMKTALAILAAPPSAFKDGTCVVEVVVSDGTKDVSVTSYRMMGPATGHHVESSR